MAPLLNLRLALLIGATVAGLSGCAQQQLPPPANTSSISQAIPAPVPAPAEHKAQATKIALLLPLAGMGETAHIAKGMKQAAEMALFEADNPAVQLIVKDDGGTPQGAMAAADAALGEGAEIILGPLYGASATAVAPLAQARGVPVVSFSNDPGVAGRGVFLMSFLAQDEIDRVVSYAASRGKRRYAALIPANAHGKTLDSALRAAVERQNGEMVRVETYAADQPSLLASAKRLFETMAAQDRVGTPVDALFVPGGYDKLTELGPLLAYSGFDPAKTKLIGTSALDTPVAARDDHMIGAWYAASDPSGWTRFAEKFRKTFGAEPPRLATLAYDATTVALELATSRAPDRFSPGTLTRADGFIGVDGPVRFLGTGLSSRALAVLEIEKYQTVVIDAPAQSSRTKTSGLLGLAGR